MFGKYAVIINYLVVNGEKNKEPYDSTVYGPNHYKLSVNGNAMIENAFKMAQDLDELYRDKNDRKLASCT